MTVRLPPEHRNHYLTAGMWQEPKPCEPALGTLSERLGILIRRHGGTTGPIRLTRAERAKWAEYLQPETRE